MPAQTLRVETVPEASNAAARLLEIATRNADQLVDEAKNEADRIVGEARTKAERLEAESKTKADKLEADARTRSQMLDSETSERRKQMFGALEQEREKLNGEVENLRSFEREYRSRLKSYFTQQLEALETTHEAPSPEGVGAPRSQAAAVDPRRGRGLRPARPRSFTLKQVRRRRPVPDGAGRSSYPARQRVSGVARRFE